MSTDTNDTPETDANTWREGTGAASECTTADFARRLERERDAARARVAELEADLEPFKHRMALQRLYNTCKMGATPPQVPVMSEKEVEP